MDESVPPDSTTSVSLEERQRVISDICKQGGMIVTCETVVTVLRNDPEKKAWEIVDYGIPGVVASENELIVCIGDYESGEIVHQFNIDSKSDYRAFKDHFHAFSSHKGSIIESFGLSFADVSVAKKILSAVKQLVPQVDTEENVPPAKRQKVEEEEGENGVENDKQTACDEDWVIIEPEDIPPQAKEDAPPQAKEDAPPQAKEDAPPQAKEDAPPQANEDAPPQAKEDAPPEAKEDAPPEAKEDVPPQAKEDAPPQAKEDAPPQAKEDVPPQAKEDAPPQAKEDAPPQAKEDAPPQAKEDVPPEGEEEVDVPFGIRKSFRRKKLNTEESAAMEISAPTDFKHISHVGSETSIVQLTAAISGAETEIEGEKAEAEMITRPPEAVVSETKPPSVPPPPPPQLVLPRKRAFPKTKVPPLPIVGVNLPEPPPISDHDALLQEVVQFDRTKLRRVTLEDIARTKNMPDSDDVSLHSLLKAGLDKMRGKLQLGWQVSRMASITSNGVEEGFDDFDFPLFEE